MNRIVEIVRNDNPNLMIITDDVYATFIPHFRSMMAELPKNTLCVYSFSKYFGATGWRLAVIALHQDNIYDRMIRELPRDKQELLKKRYSSLSLHPEDIRFIDRMVADSRQVALNHTAGLSLPQQTQMSLFASFALLDAENTYKKRMQDMIHERLHTLWESTGFTLLDDPLRAGYYSEIDMLVWAKKFYGDDFVEYLKKNYEPLDVVFRIYLLCDVLCVYSQIERIQLLGYTQMLLIGIQPGFYLFVLRRSGVSFEILGQQSFYIGMVFHELYFNVFLYIIKTSENERYLNEKCFFLKKSFFR